LGAAATVGQARDIYVDNRIGDDHANGLRPDRSMFNGPLSSIAQALRMVAAGDHIVLANTGEPYREGFLLESSRLGGSPLGRFVLDGNGAILDGSQPTPPRAWEFVSGQLFRFRPARLGYQQLFLNGRPAVRRPVLTPEDAVPDLAPLEWCLVGGYIQFSTEPGRVPQDYDLSYAALPTGILLNQVRGVAIRNLTVQGFQLDGINAHDGAIDVVLEGVTCRGNGRSGVHVAGSSRVELNGCLLGDNGTAQLLVNGFSHVWVNDSELLSNTAPATARRGGELRIDGVLSNE
jgi:hypothetical protein